MLKLLEFLIFGCKARNTCFFKYLSRTINQSDTLAKPFELAFVVTGCLFSFGILFVIVETKHNFSVYEDISIGLAYLYIFSSFLIVFYRKIFGSKLEKANLTQLTENIIDNTKK